ncbi:MAG: hypothetical protein R3C19_17025 [Planctomycetaceae bacterium]
MGRHFVELFGGQELQSSRSAGAAERDASLHRSFGSAGDSEGCGGVFEGLFENSQFQARVCHLRPVDEALQFGLARFVAEANGTQQAGDEFSFGLLSLSGFGCESLVFGVSFFRDALQSVDGFVFRSNSRVFGLFGSKQSPRRADDAGDQDAEDSRGCDGLGAVFSEEFLQAIRPAGRSCFDGFVVQVVFTSPGEVAGGAVAAGAVFFQSLQDDPVEFTRKQLRELPWFDAALSGDAGQRCVTAQACAGADGFLWIRRMIS